jgi:hypothetical protein
LSCDDEPNLGMLAATKEMRKTCETLNQTYVTNIHNSKEKVKRLIITNKQELSHLTLMLYASLALQPQANSRSCIMVQTEEIEKKSTSPAL